MPPDYDLPEAEHFYHTLTGAGVCRVTDAGWIRITGEDRVRWLNGMVTNSIQALQPGEGCFNFLLNAQGRIQGTAWVFAEHAGEALLMRTDAGQREAMMAQLDRFIIMDDVVLEDVSGSWFGLEVFGEQAGSALAQVGLVHDGSRAQQVRLEERAGARVVTYPSKVTQRIEVWYGAAAERDALEQRLTAAGAMAADAAEREWLRLMEGTPRFGQDIRDRELPQETAQTDALHFNKGCYLGQEIVERIRSRGAVHRTFRGFLLEGPLPAPGTALEADGKVVGELTSIGALPPIPGFRKGLSLGLGYVRREALERDAPLTVAGGGRAQAVMLPLALPEQP